MVLSGEPPCDVGQVGSYVKRGAIELLDLLGDGGSLVCLPTADDDSGRPVLRGVASGINSFNGTLGKLASWFALLMAMQTGDWDETITKLEVAKQTQNLQE